MTVRTLKAGKRERERESKEEILSDSDESDRDDSPHPMIVDDTVQNAYQ